MEAKTRKFLNKQISSIVEENKRRIAVMQSAYDPFVGLGSPIPRKKISFMVQGELHSVFYPVEMIKAHTVLLTLQEIGSLEDFFVKENIPFDTESVAKFMTGLYELRFAYDFEYWAVLTVKIQDKKTKKPIAFVLNRAQRKLLKALEDMRVAGVPIRIILLKARQWGGSTLVQIYMAWIQVIHKRNWHSVIVADVEDQVRNIRSMYTKMAESYPSDIGTITFKPFEGSTKNRKIVERGCIVGVGSVQKPDSLRTFDFAMCHLSEVGLWKDTKERKAKDLTQALRATIPDEPYTLEVLESTAKGIGNLFHQLWLEAISGESSSRPVFVAWWEIEMYQRPIANYKDFIQKNFYDEYVKYLWEIGATLEGINWYLSTKKEKSYDTWRMQSEYPSDPVEAFQSTGQRVYPQAYVQAARKTCKPPEFVGDIRGDAMKGKEALENIELYKDPKGALSVWEHPDRSINVSDRYAVIVDIGGRTDQADYSVIKVFDRYWMSEGGVPEVVATWRGHIDQDLLAWKAAQLAKIYCNALLVVETNSLKTMESEGEHHLTILDEIVEFYENIYTRTSPEKVRQGLPVQYGFHTNSASKALAIDAHIAALRDQEYIERDIRACDEMDTYEIKENGSYGAVDGSHDDIVMTTAIGCWIVLNYMEMPKEIKSTFKSTNKKRISEASF